MAEISVVEDLGMVTHNSASFGFLALKQLFALGAKCSFLTVSIAAGVWVGFVRRTAEKRIEYPFAHSPRPLFPLIAAILKKKTNLQQQTMHLHHVAWPSVAMHHHAVFFHSHKKGEHEIL